MKKTNLYKGTKILPLLIVLLLNNCESYDHRRSYSDCAEAMKIGFNLPDDWNYYSCWSTQMSVTNKDNTAWINADKRLTNQTTVDSIYAVENKYYEFSKDNVYIISVGKTAIDGNEAYYWEWMDSYGLNKFKVYITHKNKFDYVFKFSSKDTMSYNNTISSFDLFINSLHIF